MRLLQSRAGEYGLILLCAALTGCVHRQQTPLPAAKVQTPSVYVPLPDTTALPPMKAEDIPPSATDAKPAVAEEVKPKKRPKRKEAPPAVPPAAAVVAPPAADPLPPAPDAASLGALRSGPSTDPKQQQEVAAKIAGVEKRLTELPSVTQDREQKQIAKVRYFLKEASDALKSGDVEGAGILATKAELLLEDISK